MSKRLLRGIIDFGDAKISEENINVNYQRISRSNFEWANPDEGKLYSFIKDYVSRNHEPPSAHIIRDFFERLNEQTCLEKLQDIQVAEIYYRTHYETLLQDALEEQTSSNLRKLLQDVEDIATKGRIVGVGKDKHTLRGVKDSLLYFNQRIYEMIPPDTNSRTGGDVLGDSGEAWEEYQKAKVNKGLVYGKFCGIEQIDVACHGIKKGEMWIHAAYTGELKCLAGDATVFDHITNRRRTLAELFETGDLPALQALDRAGETFRLLEARASHLIQNGIRDVFDLVLSSGRRVGATANHRFFTPAGWRELGSLREGDFVAVPGKSRMTPGEVRVTDESGKGYVSFTDANTVSRRRFIDFLLDQGLPEGKVIQALEGDLDWDRVSSVTLRGQEMTYDLSVPEHHSFVVNDIVSHNTTFALNWVYNLVTRYRSNVLYVSLEMKYEHLRRLVCAMHTANGSFAAERYGPLDYRKIRDGELSPDDEVFYKKALDDFDTNPDYCRLEVWAPDREVTIHDIRVHAELLHRTMDVGMIVIDHGGLVQATKGHRDYTIELNSVLREAKKLSLHFNGGEGVPVLLLFQINRDGKSTVDKQSGTDEEGVYRMSHLSYANEAERSADYITTTYLNKDLRKQGATIMANLKNRDNDPFAPVKVRVDFSCRRMLTWDPADQQDMGHEELSQEDLELAM